MEASGRGPAGYGRIGDDVAIVPVRGRKLVLKVDMLVEKTDVPKGMTYRQAGRKAVAMCVSDFAAKGVRPELFMASVGVRRGTSRPQIDDLARGLKDAETEWKVRIVGGDTNEADQLVVDCVMAGFSSKIVGRGGAAPGDILVVTGTFGYPPSGLKILLEGAKSSKSFRNRAISSVLNPRPDLQLGLALSKYLTSSMDSSDGLARSIHTLARASKVGFEVDSLPEGKGVRRFAENNGLDPEKLVSEGGEEYIIVGTIKPRNVSAAKRAASRMGRELIVIGRVTDHAGKVKLRSGRGFRAVRDEGWTHLR